MTTTTIDTSASLPRLDGPFLIAALLGAALLIALVGLDGQPASAALIVLGFALGVAFLKAEFSFTAAWRRFLVSGEAGGLLGALLLIAVAALGIVPVAALVPGFGGAIAPIGPSLVIGAFVFGIGMQLANGCGSGTLGGFKRSSQRAFCWSIAEVRQVPLRAFSIRASCAVLC